MELAGKKGAKGSHGDLADMPEGHRWPRVERRGRPEHYSWSLFFFFKLKKIDKTKSRKIRVEDQIRKKKCAEIKCRRGHELGLETSFFFCGNWISNSIFLVNMIDPLLSVKSLLLASDKYPWLSTNLRQFLICVCVCVCVGLEP